MFIRKFFIAFLFICFATSYGDQEPLKMADVHRIMKVIFQRHVDKKQMNAEIMQHAIYSYIDQFDPSRIYLLEEEITPYGHLEPSKLQSAVQQYENNDYSTFKQLDKLFQQAVTRAREIRDSLYKNPDEIYNQAVQNQSKPDSVLFYPSFAISTKELQGRIKEDLIKYIRGQISQFGKEDVLANRQSVLKNYEDEAITRENSYIYKNMDGKAIAIAVQENLFALHVLKALAGTLDAHTSVYNPEEAYDMRVRLEKGLRGVGIVAVKKPEGVFVDRIYKGSPAEKANTIKVGDRIVEVNGRNAHSIPFEELIEMLGGDHAKQVTLLIKRRGGIDLDSAQQTYTVILQPAMITVNDDRVQISHVPYENGIIGTITLKSFYKGANGITSENDVAEAIAQLKKIGLLKGLILDLRGNSGGFLIQAVKVAGMFITNGVVVISKYSNGEEHFYRDVDGKISYQGPLIVLTSKTTASAAEIVAQALQDYGVALIAGDPQTYGKGTIQSQTVTGGDQAASYFKVTVGKYYTVSGKTPQIGGVKADIVIPGELSFQEIGEEYFEDAVPADRIADAYNDPLADIDPQMKPWYLHYYMPTLQQKQPRWAASLPGLKQKSLDRIQHNPQYQKYLTLLIEGERRGEKVNLMALHDLQHEEAINIMKDMIPLDGKLKKAVQN